MTTTLSNLQAAGMQALARKSTRPAGYGKTEWHKGLLRIGLEAASPIALPAAAVIATSPPAPAPGSPTAAFNAMQRSIEQSSMFDSPRAIVWSVVSTASFAASVYHGYKRNDSIGWAIWWGVMGALFPVITPVVAVAQGYGKKAGSK